jgi:hypothetical protein
MNRKRQLDDVGTRAMRATARDGITEMLLGLLLLVFGALFYLRTPLAALGALLPLALTPLGRYLKQRFVYPRTGYARPARAPHAVRGIVLVAVASVAGILAVLGGFVLVLGLDRGRTLFLSHFVPAIAGLLMAIGPLTVARTYRLARWYVLAAVLVLTGVALPLSGVSTGYEAIAFQSAMVGGLSLFLGIGLFLSFLRRVPLEAPHVAD